MLTVETIDKAVTLTDAEKPKVKDAVDEYTKAMQDARNGGPIRTANQADRCP